MQARIKQEIISTVPGVTVGLAGDIREGVQGYILYRAGQPCHACSPVAIQLQLELQVAAFVALNPATWKHLG